MESSGADDPLIMVVGEAPGEQEDDKGIPFVGSSGQLLRDVFSTLELEDEVRYTNVVRCRPPDNKISKKAINHCKHYVLEELEYYKPELVLLMGNTPLSAILGESGITTWNGVSVRRGDTTYVPLFHPAYIRRNMGMLGEWHDALAEAIDSLDAEDEDVKSDYEYPLTMAEVKEMIAHLQGCDMISYDLETTSLDPFESRVVAASFSGGGRTFAVPLSHENSPWLNDELNRVYKRIGSFLRDYTERNRQVVGHNIKFDQQHTISNIGIDFEASGDTMLISHLLDSRRGIHSLKRLAGLHLGMYDYDKELRDYISKHPEADPDKGGNYGNIPLDILLPYAAMDADATLKLHEMLYPQLSARQKDFYHEVVIPASNSLARMEYNGIVVDEYIARRYAIIYQNRYEELYEDLLKDSSISKAVKLIQRRADDKIMGDIVSSFGPDIKSMTVDGTHINYVTAKGRRGRRKRNLIEFNPGSYIHMTTLYYDVHNIPVIGTTKSGAPSTSYKVVKPLAKEFPIIEKVRYVNLISDVLSTYLLPASTKGWHSKDGLVHSNYLLHGTLTGRLSSNNPNLQNIPTPEKEPGTLLEILPIKNIFTTRWLSGYLLAADYSGMELRVFASAANCKDMLEIHRRGVDFHSVVAVMVDEMKEISDIDDDYVAWFKKNKVPVRYKYKWTNWTLLYGGGAYTLYNMYGIPMEEAEYAVDKYYDRFPEVLLYQDKCVDFAETHGYIESLFGRREYLPYIRDHSDKNKGLRRKAVRSAINMPVQSTAGDTLLCAMVVIDDMMYKQGYEALMVNTVHDSLVFDVPSPEVNGLAALCKDVMENIHVYAVDYMPNLDFSWLKCPLKADVEVGTHYGAEISYNEWKEEREAFLL